MSVDEALQLRQLDWQLRKREVTALLQPPVQSPTSPFTMLDYTNTHAIFPPQGANPYLDKSTVIEIETLRKSFDGILFIDRVLSSLRILPPPGSAGKTQHVCGDHCYNHYICTAGQRYPPRDERGLRNLHTAICNAKVSTHHKLSVIYYLLLDFDLVRGHTSTVADDFVSKSGLPRKYHLMMRGLWHMDRKEFKFAVEYLTHPSLPSEFGDEIITVLIRHAQDDFSLPLAYYHTTQPVLHTSDALSLLFDAIAQTSITEALYFSRAYPESTRRQLFEKLISLVLDSTAEGTRLKELVGLPFDGIEEGWFSEYLTTGEGRKLKLAANAAETRLIVTGRHRGQIRIRGSDENVASKRTAKAAR